jgi:hypothetical protein
MTNFLKYACFSSLIFCSFSCRETFDDSIPNSEANVLVVDGTINDGPGPYTIRLSRSVSFNSDNQVEVNKAEVYVMDDLNKRYDFIEKSSGLYLSDSSGFRGQMGKNYTLYVNTNDSLRYKSTPCTIGPPSIIDSVYSISEQSKVHIYADISFRSDIRMSTKIDASIAIGSQIDTQQYLPHYFYFKLEYDTVHIYTSHYTLIPLNIEPVLKTNTDYIAGSKIKNVPLFYLNYPMSKRDTVEIDSLNRIIYSRGFDFIIVINASTLSNETFNYYYNLINQSGGKNSFFEPVPVQLTGNIKCINNSTKAAYGLFQANAIVKRYYRIDKYIMMEEVNGIPPLTRIIDTI